MKNKGILYAVYGTLRKEQSNHYLLENKLGVDYIGHYVTKPKYTMFDINGGFPGVIPEGNTSITLEIYEIDNKFIERRLDALEGYYGKDNDMYKKDIIQTPFGPCFIYFYNCDCFGLSEIESGDWIDHKNIKHV